MLRSMARRRPTERVSDAFHRAAERLVGVRSRCTEAFDGAIEMLEAAGTGIRDVDLGHTKEWREKRRAESGVWCTICEDTGTSDGGWCDGSPCHCAMGVLREEAEKAGLIVPSEELLKRRENSV